MKTILRFERREKDLPLPGLYSSPETLPQGVNLRLIPFGASPAQARKLIEFWKPAGCIVNDDILPCSLFRGIPTLYLHRDPASIPRNAKLFSFDERMIGETAARELLAANCAAFAYVPLPSDPYWSRIRGKAFADALRMNGLEAAAYRWRRGSHGTARDQKALGKWLKELPRPLGVFAANDEVGVKVVDLCNQSGLSIPDELAIVGVDDITLLCDNCRPTLSSIRLSRPGDNGALETILNCIERPNAVPKCTYVPPVGVVRRTSTKRLATPDAQVSAALDFIRYSATLPETDVTRVVRECFDCSRRMAEIRFRKATGRSILAEIRSCRLAKAQALRQENRYTCGYIATACGYSTTRSLHRLLAASRPQSDK